MKKGEIIQLFKNIGGKLAAGDLIIRTHTLRTDYTNICKRVKSVMKPYLKLN